MKSSNDIIHTAWKSGFVIPAFNIPYLPMMAPVVAALRDCGTFGFLAVARLEWEKFGADGPEAVRAEYEKTKDPAHTRLHLDHVPVIDEDDIPVDYKSILRQAISLGYDSVMVDGSRLDLDGNIAATREIVEMAHAAGIPVEAELGAVMGHEAGPLPPYEELFASGKGFTDPDELERFVAETKVDWMSVAVGSIHGAISEAAKGREKPAARLNIDHLAHLQQRVAIPFVLHGGTGIPKEYIQRGIEKGIAKINIGHAIRNAHIVAGQNNQDQEQAVYQAARRVIEEDLDCAGTASRIG